MYPAVKPVCVWVRICLLDTSASSALGVFDDNVLYKSTYLLVCVRA